MNPILKSSRSIALLASAAAFSATPTVQADLTKANNIFTLDLATSWTDGTLTPTAADVLIWDNTVVGANAVSTGAPLSVAGLKILNPGGLVTINSTSTTTITLGASGIDMSSATQNLTLAGAGPILGAAQTWTAASGRTLTVSGTAMDMGGNVLTLAGDGNFAFTSTITSSAGAGLIKNGAGTVFLQNNAGKNFQGNISLNNGTINLNHQNTYNGTVTAANGTTITNNAGNTFVSITATGNISINSASTRYGSITGGANTLTFLTGTTKTRGASPMNGTTLDVRSGATAQTGDDQNNGWSSTSTITKIGTGTWTLQNGQLTATTGIIINEGVLRNNSSNRFGDTTALSIDGSTAVYDLQTFTDTVGAVSLKNGGSITGTSTGALTSSSFSLESGSVSAILAGAGAVTKSTVGTVTLSGANTYTGDTTVDAGKLAVNGTSIPNAGKLFINGSGQVEPTGTEVVGSLYFDGVIQATGTWGSSSALPTPDHIDNTHFSGTGLVNVAAGYSGWAAINAPGQTAAQDYDSDGMPNGVEYFMNAPTGFTANPTLNSSNVISWTNGGNIAPSAYGTQYVVQTSINLVNWVDVPVGSLTTNTTSSLQYTLPAGADRSFVRLLVTPN